MKKKTTKQPSKGTHTHGAHTHADHSHDDHSHAEHAHNEHDHAEHGNPEGHGGIKPVKITFYDFKMDKAFAFDPAKGETGKITYTLKEPGRISIKVLKAKTRELYLATLVNWEQRDAGTHTETWDGKDYAGNIVDFTEAIIMLEGEPLSTYKPDNYSLSGMSNEDIIHGHPMGHAHNEYRDSANIVPDLEITSIKDGDVLSGLVVIESQLPGEKGYGDEAGYGVRYYLDNTLVTEEFYDRSCGGKFTYTLDTTAYSDGPYTLYVGMCDHHQHATSRGHRIRISNAPSKGENR